MISVCDPRTLLKLSADVVYQLDGNNASVILQGATWAFPLFNILLVVFLL